MPRQLTALLTGILGICLATSVLARPHPGERTAAEKDALEAQIVALQGKKGAAAEAQRRALPVPGTRCRLRWRCFARGRRTLAFALDVCFISSLPVT
jgi:hypothetical protein